MSMDPPCTTSRVVGTQALLLHVLDDSPTPVPVALYNHLSQLVARRITSIINTYIRGVLHDFLTDL